jgi:hypothetical protein
MSEPNPFFADDKTEDDTRDVTAYLDLSQNAVGTYYFNKEDNYNYLRNWFNYPKFQMVGEHTMISEVVQYSRPEIVAASLDTNKTYALPATTMTVDWAARVQTGQPTAPKSPGFSGLDAAGNVYLLSNYFTSVNCTVYNANNTLAFTKTPNGALGSCACLSKFSASGAAEWAVRLRGQNANDTIEASYCVTDAAGTTYILGVGSNVLICEDAAGIDTFVVNVANRTFLVAYDSTGEPLWVTYFSLALRGALAVDNQILGSVLVYFEKASALAVSFYDNVLILPTVTLTIPGAADANVVLVKYACNSGLFQWVTYMTGFRLGLTLNWNGWNHQSIACDSNGNIVVTGYYTQLDHLYNAASSSTPVFRDATIEIPPFATPIVWVPHESDREWSAVDVEQSGQFMLAAVDNGLIYVSKDFGETWDPRATVQRWNSVYTASLGSIMLASVYESILYRSLDQGQSWIPTGGKGATSRKWVALAGNETGSQLVAIAQNDYIYQSIDYGATWTIAQSIQTTGQTTLAVGQNYLDSMYIESTDQYVFVGTRGGIVARENDLVSLQVTGFRTAVMTLANPPAVYGLGIGTVIRVSGITNDDVYNSQGVVTTITAVSGNTFTYNPLVLSASSAIGLTGLTRQIQIITPAVVVRADVSGAVPGPLVSVTLNNWENGLRASVYHTATNTGFFGTDTAPGQIVQIGNTPARLGAVTLTDLNAVYPVSKGVMATSGTEAYVAMEYTTQFLPGIQLFRLNFTNNSAVPVIDRNGTLSVNDQVRNVYTLGSLVYVATRGRIVKWDISTWAQVSMSATLGSGTDLTRAGCVASTGGVPYAYVGSNEIPAKVYRVQLDTNPPTLIETLTLNAGENNTLGAVADPAGTYAYFCTNTTPGQIVQLQINVFPMVRTAAIPLTYLTVNYGAPRVMQIDPLGQFLYVGTQTSPGYVLKVQLPAMTIVGVLNTGVNSLFEGAIDTAGTYLYLTSSSSLVRVTLATFTVTATYTVTPGFGVPSSSNADCTGVLLNSTRLYYQCGEASPLAFVNQLDVTGGVLSPLTPLFFLNYRENNLRCGVRAPSSNYAYFAACTQGVNSGGLNNAGARIVKIQLSPSLVYLGSVAADSASDAYFSCGVIDSLDRYAYFGTNTAPARICKFDVTGSLPVQVGSALVFPSGVNLNNLSCAVIDSLNQFAYFVTGTSPGIVVKLELSTMTLVKTVTLQTGQNAVTCVFMDPAGLFLYLTTDTAPAYVITVSLLSFQYVAAVNSSAYYAPGRFLSGVMTYAGNNLVYGSGTAPGTIVRYVKQFSPAALWKDVAYSAQLDAFVAIVPNGLAYASFDQAQTWTAIPTTPAATNWAAIAGARALSQVNPYPFYVVVDGGVLYGLSYNAGVWTWSILDPVSRPYTGVATSGGNAPLTFAAVDDGAIYLAVQEQVLALPSFIPTTIPRAWNTIAMTSRNGPVYTLAAVRGGQLYVTYNPYPYVHTYVVKYNPVGVVQWAAYVNCPTTDEGNNYGTCITCTPRGEVVVSGVYDQTIECHSFKSEYDVIVKRLPTHNFAQTGLNPYNNFLACYSADGLPIWMNSAVLTFSSAYPTTPGLYTSVRTDSVGNVYAFGYSEQSVFYNPNDFQVASQSTGTAILVQYYPDGYMKSYTRLANVTNPNTPPGYAFSGSVHLLNGFVYLTGCNNDDVTLNVYNSLGSVVGQTEAFSEAGNYVVRFSTSTASLTPLPAPVYNNPFQPSFTVGGSKRSLVNGYVKDGTVEAWGGQTSLPPSAITVADLNAGVISYLGHQIGYSIPLVDGYPTQTDYNYRHLIVQIAEPSFPANDPQPVTPGSIPYGYLPIYITVPAYATGVTWNVAQNNSTPLRLSTTGTVSTSGLFFTGVSVGDVIRILVQTNTTSRYVTLQVDSIVLSDSATQTPAALLFTVPSRYLATQLEGGSTASSTLITLGSVRYVAAFVLPPVIREGTLRLILQLYPQYRG